jgi:signal transduction histidine kinase
MRNFFLGSLSFFILTAASGQSFLDTLHKSLYNAKTDSSKALSLAYLATYYAQTRSDSTIYYARQAIDLSDRIHYIRGTFLGQRAKFFVYNSLGNYPKALELADQNKRLVEDNKADIELKMEAIQNIGLVNFEESQYAEAKQLFWDAISLEKSIGHLTDASAAPYMQLGILYLKQMNMDSAIVYTQLGYDHVIQNSRWTRSDCLAPNALGNAYFVQGNFLKALHYYQVALNTCMRYNNSYLMARVYRDYSRLYLKSGHSDSCIRYANLALGICLEYNFGDYASDVCKVLVELYKSKEMPDSALKYLQAMVTAKDSIFSQTRANEFLMINLDEKQRQREIEIAQTAYRNKIRILVMAGLLSIFLLLAGILYRNNLQRKKSNRQLQVQKKELESALQNLQTTQKQLIQSEKMASLGEITAGIAHEIQNPLNFVNNFSEVNGELAVELAEALDSGNEKQAKDLAFDIKQNADKINQHGKRADAIVKSMLMHAGSSSGQKSPSNINALVSECFQIAYHNIRARDKSFNLIEHESLDDTIGKINIQAQDMSRALLNIFNNAFYSLKQKKSLKDKSGQPFDGTIWITTMGSADSIEIRIKDNGMGIPENISGKILQPFFTTKPTGEGTGLGLSLTHDIISKLHNGSLKFVSAEGEFAEFIIQLPKE